uniref:NTR domain-containing protein n=1 Tax=Sinocyclocheilus grahami TaxID=75366 RepID=A0A672L938_SINGR
GVVLCHPSLLFFLSVALNEQVTEGCRCLPKHPQQQFCASDIGTSNTCIANQTRTDVIFKHEGSISEDISRYEKRCVYTVKLTLTGPVEDGRVVLDLCNRVEPWNQLSRIQKMYLSRYQRGCVCEPCHRLYKTWT